MIIERQRQVNNSIFGILVYLFLSDNKIDAVDSQIVDGGPPQKLIDPTIFVTGSGTEN
jgi:hypothetical protein